MGVNTLTYVPGTTDLGTLTLAIQRLTDADSVKVEATDLYGEAFVSAKRDSDSAFAGMFNVTIKREDGFGDGEKSHHGTIHLSAHVVDDSGKSFLGTLVYGGNASAFWASLGDALVDLFGGINDYNDCDATVANTQKRPTVHSKVDDGEKKWLRTQAVVKALTTVTDLKGLRRYDTTEGLRNRRGEYRSGGHVYNRAS